jgi:glycerophosphoryl diester phosphodiesterase
MKWIGTFLLLLSLSCKQKRIQPTIWLNPLEYSNTNFDKQGHRGCRGLMPENTIAAMYRAIDLGVTTLEMDVVITRDSQVLVSHEAWMGHEIATKPDGSYITQKEEKNFNIYRMDYSETTRFDVGMKPHPRFPTQQKTKATKPLLADLLDSVQLYCNQKNKPLPFFNIETKCLPLTDRLFHPEPAAFVERLMRVIQTKQLNEKVIIQSFDFRSLQYLYQNYPGIKTAMLVEDTDKRTPGQLLEALAFTPNIYSPHYSLVTTGLVSFCHERKIKLIPWTVNDKVKMAELTKMGVDGIITDYPNLF